MQAEVAFLCEAQLGEGASWDVARNRLWWVDILGKRVFCGDTDTGSVAAWDMPTEVGAAVGAADGRRALVLRDHVALFDAETGATERFWTGTERAENRFNDAGTDPEGCLWIASMDFDATAETGALWRLSRDGNANEMHGHYACVNGPVFAPDGRMIYFCDTMGGRVLKAPYVPDADALGPVRLHIDLGDFGGLSDGMAIDAEGCLWLARFTAGRVTRYDPDGAAMTTFALPVPMVTSLAFGGPDLGLLYATTARIILSATDLAAYPTSGSVYVLDPGVKGLRETPFGGML